MHKRTGFTVGLGDSDADIARRVRSFLRDQGVDGLEVVRTGTEVRAAVQRGTGKMRVLVGAKIGSKTLRSTKAIRKGRDVNVSPGASRLAVELDAARARGAGRRDEIVAGPEMLTGEEFGQRIGISRQAVDKRRQAGSLIGLEGPSRGIRYPDWQITPEGGMLPGIREVLDLTSRNPWSAYRVLVEEFPDGSGERVFHKLQQGETAAALAHVEAVVAGSVT